jgi:hypothetical protein
LHHDYLPQTGKFFSPAMCAEQHRGGISATLGALRGSARSDELRAS